MSVIPTRQPDPAAKLPSNTISLRGRSGQEVCANIVDIGKGLPVVFLHGLVGLNEHWKDAARLISSRTRCLLFELPLLSLRGADCSIDGVTSLTAEYVQRHVGEPAVLVGNSFGGHVALQLALERPELVRALILAGSSGLLERTIVSDVQLRPSREWLTRKIGELFHDPSHLRQSDVERAHRELSRREGARAMVRLSRSARRNHLGDRIAEIGLPTQLVWGREDIVTPPEAADEFMTKLQDARITWLDNCGHAPMIEQPELFAKAVIAFIDELERRTAPPTPTATPTTPASEDSASVKGP